MARIAGIDLPKQKRIEIALTYIYGIGLSRSKAILKKIQIDPNRQVINLNDDDITSIRNILDTEYVIEGDLRQLQSINIKRLMEINSYKGKRHRIGLPLRGQRTRTNARTRRGIKKTMAGKKKAPKK
uniref:Small ribosomal subunit protein uS13c n=1 Tax=Corallina officinalis TaxID=35170 RepID=A0A6M3WBC7_COROI|nr:30S ribosomal protein S13 [Corallina officinalis]QJF58552.1 30S ribosomal protein S13 [Corallina officinalis]QJF58751.1 30S ribosomal protein S13 [Corallina officinalis]QJF58950.1 30S ribosomal protein S13 [Corallina officinalis]